MTDAKDMSRRAFLCAAAGTSATAGAAGAAAAQEGGGNESDGGSGGNETDGGSGGNESDGGGGEGGGGEGGGGGGGGGEGGGGSEVPTVPESAKVLGVATSVSMVATLGLVYFFIKYGGDYAGDIQEQ